MAMALTFYQLRLRPWLMRTLLLSREALETIEWGGIAAVLLIGALIAYGLLGGQIVNVINRVINFLR